MTTNGSSTFDTSTVLSLTTSAVVMQTTDSTAKLADLTESHAATVVTSSAFWTSDVASLSASAKSPESLAIIIGCTVAAAVLLVIIIILVLCFFVRPALVERRTRKRDAQPEVVIDTSDFKKFPSKMHHESHLSVWNGDPTTMIGNISSANGVAAVKVPAERALWHSVPTIFGGSGLATAVGLDNINYRGHRTQDDDSQYGGSVNSGGLSGTASHRNSCESTVALHHPSPDNSLRKQTVCADELDDRKRRIIVASPDVIDREHVTSQQDGGQRSLTNRASVKSLSEDVWNSTVDMAFDSALSIYEPM